MSCTTGCVESSKRARLPWQVHSVVHRNQILQGVCPQPHRGQAALGQASPTYRVVQYCSHSLMQASQCTDRIAGQLDCKAVAPVLSWLWWLNAVLHRLHCCVCVGGWFATISRNWQYCCSHLRLGEPTHRLDIAEVCSAQDSVPPNDLQTC